MDKNSISSVKETHKFYWLPVFIFVILLGLSSLITYKLKNTIDSKVAEYFSDEVNLVEQAITTRGDIYINTLRSGIGLFNASDSVSRNEWKIFTDTIDLQANFPGIQGFGYSQVVPAIEKETFINDVRSQGYPDFNIRPEGIRSEYTAILYLEPFDIRNQQAFGYDMFSEATRHEAMSLARNTGNPQMSGRVTLVQEIDEDVQAGFLIYLPLYDTSKLLDSIEDRKEAILGYVYSPFRAGDFFNGLFLNRELLVDFAVFDGVRNDFNQDYLMYSSLEKGQYFDNSFWTKSKFKIRRIIQIGNHEWTIYFSAKSELFDAFSGSGSLTYIYGLAIFICCLISFIIYIFINHRNRAINLANNITEDLQKTTRELKEKEKILEATNKDLNKQKKKLSTKVSELNEVNKYLVSNEMKLIKVDEKKKYKEKE